MKSETFLADMIGIPERQAISNLFSSPESESFSKKIQILGLKKERDFRHVDLRNADFSHTDLRGFDFTGSDLRGTVGVNVSWDNSTIFDGAILDGSFFEMRVARDRFFREQPEWEREFQRINRSDYADASLYAMKVSSTDHVGKIHVALRLFHQNQDLTVRTSIMLASRYYFANEADHFAFLLEALSTGDTRVMYPAANALSNLYAGRPETADVLVNFIDNPDPMLRTVAVRAGFASNSWRDHYPRIWRQIQLERAPEIRRAFVGRLASRLGFRTEIATTDPDFSTGVHLDFASTIGASKLEKITEVFLKECLAHVTKDKGRLTMPNAAKEVLDVFVELKRYGLRFSFSNEARNRFFPSKKVSLDVSSEP